MVNVAGVSVRLGAGESLELVTRAQRSVARAFLIAGALGLALVLIASYLAGAAVSAPLRRMARVATRVDDGDLLPRMSPPPSAASEIRVLAESFNHMLDRLEVAFKHQRDFVADASHELRTPLTVISGQLEVLAAQDRPTPEEIRRVQRLVGAEIARISRMVDDMLLLARAEQRDFLHPSHDRAAAVHRRSLGDNDRRATAPAGARARSLPAPCRRTPTASRRRCAT